jgi:GNAT superfamily N-acetyltransferase
LSEPLRIRDWRPDEDDARLLELSNAAFGLARDAAWWRWKFRDNPAGPAEIALAEEGGRAVSMACAMPRELLIGGRPARGAQSVDIATLPAYRGRGLYTRVAQHLWSRLAERGFTCTYGFTNAQSTGVTLERLGRVPVGALPVRLRPLRPLAALAGRLGIARPPERAAAPACAPGIRVAGAIDARFDELWSRLACGADIAGVRDARYLRWRYLARPDARYEVLVAESAARIDGYAIWRRLERFGLDTAFVADVAADPASAGAAARLLAEVSRRARAAGASLLALLSWPACAAHAAARRAAWLPLPAALFPQVNVFSVISHDPALPTSALADPARWWLAWGDSDVV